jgi:nucleoside-diphosphate-sugar epimerase
VDKVVISGITGFLGSHIAQAFLSKKKYKIIGLKRSYSNTWRCSEYYDEIEWINVDDGHWKKHLVNWRPKIIIHSAWQGINAAERDNHVIQFNNLILLIDLLEISNEIKVEKFIGLGSQAEYGEVSKILNEEDNCNPISSYGLAKLLAMQITKLNCSSNHINWYWLRLFSFFGEKESMDWLIPTVIKNLYEKTEMKMTPGEQQYAYMYVGDLVGIVIQICERNLLAGVYNISSQQSISLHNLVEKIGCIANLSTSNIHFGKLSYRPNQPMLIQGDVTKLKKQLGIIRESCFEESLRKTIVSVINSITATT